MTRRPIVLVVEDEPLRRMAGADMVESAGLEVVEAANATEDGMSGVKLAPQIGLLRPGIAGPAYHRL